MAFCSNCGKEFETDAKYCSGCGVALDVANKNEKEQRKTVYDGDLHKCPKCGEHLNAFVTTCPVCNYELRGAQTTSCVHELAQKLEKTEFDGDKTELISNFYIPNTKEDIYEFFVLAYSHITAGGYGIEAWSIKLEQAYLKARLAFGNSEEYEHIKELYENINKGSSMKRKLKSKDGKAIVLFALGLVIAGIGFVMAFLDDNINGLYFDDLYLGVFIALGCVCFVFGLVMWMLPNKKRKSRKNK